MTSFTGLSVSVLGIGLFFAGCGHTRTTVQTNNWDYDFSEHGSGELINTRSREPFQNNGSLDIGYVINTDVFMISPTEIKQLHANVVKVMNERFGITVGFTWAIWEDKKHLKSWHQLPPERLPEYVVTFTRDRYMRVKNLAGYTFDPIHLWRPRGFCNEFPFLPRSRKTVYQSWIDYDSTYGRCGYDRAGIKHISDTSRRWELGKPGTPCIWNGSYWILKGYQNNTFSDLLIRNTDTIIHELLHNFGLRGDNDHDDTRICASRLGNSAMYFDPSDRFYTYRPPYFSLGMCPDLLKNMVDSYKPCPATPPPKSKKRAAQK